MDFFKKVIRENNLIIYSDFVEVELLKDYNKEQIKEILNVIDNTKLLKKVNVNKNQFKEADRRANIQFNKANRSKKTGAVYLFNLNKRYDLDGNTSYNAAKYINHSCNPNCEAVNIDGEIWILALKDIKKDEELSYDYGYALDDYKDHICLCNSDNCIGYILDKKQWKKAKVVC